MTSRLRELFDQPLAIALAFGFLGAAAVLAARAAGWLQPVELLAYDQFVRWRAEAGSPDARIVVVAATEAELDPYKWPFPDGVVADVLAAVLAQRPRAVGLDIYRHEPRPPGDKRLAALLARNDNVIAVMKFEEGGKRAIAAPPVLAAHPQRVGFADLVEDMDGVVRKGLLYLDDGRTVQSSLALRVALAYLGAEGIRPGRGAHDPSHLRLGAATLRPLEPDDGGYVDADAAGYQFLLDFAGGAAPFRHYSFGDVLGRRVAADAFRDRVVLVGVTAESAKDYFATPFRVGKGAAAPVYGVTLHAHAASQLVRMAKGEARPIRTLSGPLEALWILAWCVAGAALGSLRRGLRFYLWLALGGLAALALGCHNAFQASWWLPLVPAALGFPVSAALVTGYLTRREYQQRETLMRLFSRYVSRPLADEVWQRRGELLEAGRLKPRRLVATVLFSDVRGFTTLAEQLEPQQLMDWLSEYLRRMADIVHAHGGVVDKFVGDAVMAVFGLHGGTEREAAAAAVESALAAREELASLNAGWRARGLEAIGMRIGIHTGELAYGTVGGGERVESTVIGDAVNIAARLESYDRDATDPQNPGEPCRILVSSDTYALLDGKYLSWELGGVRLKGKAREVSVLGIRGRA